MCLCRASLNHIFRQCLPIISQGGWCPWACPCCCSISIFIRQTKEGWSGRCGGTFRRLGRWLGKWGLGTGLGDSSLALGGPVCAQWGWGWQVGCPHTGYVVCVCVVCVRGCVCVWYVVSVWYVCSVMVCVRGYMCVWCI